MGSESLGFNAWDSRVEFDHCDTDVLLQRASAGDESARGVLFARHRGRLLQMVSARLDSRLAARVDPSDIVQEALVDASRMLSDYLEHRPLPFYPWLRKLACLNWLWQPGFMQARSSAIRPCRTGGSTIQYSGLLDRRLPLINRKRLSPSIEPISQRLIRVR